MPQRTVANITLVTVGATKIATSQTPTGAGNLTLDGALTSGGTYTAADAAHKITIVSAADETARTFVITGTDADGVAQTESVAGVNANTATSTKYFKTVTSISVDAATAGAITVGIASAVQTRTIQVNTRSSSFQVTNAFVVSGTINYTLSHTYDKFMNTPDINQVAPTNTVTYIDDATVASKTANFASLAAQPVSASKLTVNSYNTGATIRWNIVEDYGS